MVLSKHWKSGRYGFEHLVLTRSIQPTVHYESGGYVGNAFGHRLPRVYQSCDEAKAAVEQAVFRVLDSALARLNDKEQRGE